MAFEYPAHLYESIRAGFRDLTGETDLIAGLLPDSGGRVLDLGCGTGTVLRSLAARGHTGVGVDTSTSFIEHAKANASDAERYELTSMTTFDTDEQFDVVTCLFATLNLVDPAELPELLGKVRRWLKPGGALVLEAAHLLNFVDTFETSQVFHHGDITRLVRVSVNAHKALWRNEESLVVAGEPAAMYTNSFDQWVLTGPHLNLLLAGAGFESVVEYGSFRKTPPPPFGKGPLIHVAV